MNIKEVREKFPQYSDLSDVELANALHQKFYSDIPKPDFMARIGLSAPTRSESFMEGQKDVGMGAARTIAGGIRSGFPLIGRAVELATTGRVGTIMDKPNEARKSEEADYEARRNAVGETGFDWWRMGGAAASPWNALTGRLAMTRGRAGPGAIIRGGVRAGVAGGGMSGVTDQERAMNAGIGAVVGGGVAAVPALTAGMQRLVSPFTRKGAERKAGEIIRKSAVNADDAARNLSGPWPGISQPTTAMQSGDEGVAALMNTVQDKVPEVKSAGQRAAANREVARTTFAQTVGGNADDLMRMQEARDAVTAPMRDAVLSRARPIPAGNLIDPIDQLMRVPEMAGKTNQTALAEVRANLARITGPDGTINPTALYEIRKDINLMMDGKLSGDAANMKFARKALTAIKNAVDDQIDAAGEKPGVWKAYLNEFAGRSKAIDQMATFQDVIRRSGTGQVNPQTGEPILSAAMLNRILKNNGAELKKSLTSEQFDALRRLAGDLSAEQAAARASRSSTLQSVTNTQGNMNAALDLMIGRVPGGGMLTRLGQMLTSGNQDRVLGLLGESALDPATAARLMQAGAPPLTKPMQGLLTGGVIGAGVPALLTGVQ